MVNKEPLIKFAEWLAETASIDTKIDVYYANKIGDNLLKALNRLEFLEKSIKQLHESKND